MVFATARLSGEARPQYAEPANSWIVRFVGEDHILKVRTFQTEEAALAFMQRVRANELQDLRSWAEVRTTELPLPR